MRCPVCASDDLKVVDSRPVEENNSIRRRRECEKCHARFTTYEIVDTLNPIVVKKDGSKEIFDKNKLLSGLIKACEKRPLDAKILADEIESSIRSTMKTEITQITPADTSVILPVSFISNAFSTLKIISE